MGGDVMREPIGPFKKMNEIVQNFFTSTRCPDFSKTTLRVMVVKMLADNGSITNRDLVRLTNGQTWITSDLRRDGFIKPFHADTWETGQSGKRYKRYWWTGKTLEGKK
jgi:hypothetical protein